MTDKCTSPEGHKEYGPWRIRYSTYLAQIKIERTNGRLVEEMPKEEAHRILNSHASLTEKVRLAVIELVEQDKWEEPVKRLCEIAGLEYPAITAKVEPQSVADAHEGE